MAVSVLGGVGVNLPILTEIAKDLSVRKHVSIVVTDPECHRSVLKGGLQFWPGSRLWKVHLLVFWAMPWQQPWTTRITSGPSKKKAKVLHEVMNSRSEKSM